MSEKDIYKKELPVVHFTNILCPAFSYESFARGFFVLEVKVKLFTGAKKMSQLRSKNVGEIDSSFLLLTHKSPFLQLSSP
jgi:hypothetical protein